MNPMLVSRPQTQSERLTLQRISEESENAELVLSLALDHVSAGLAQCRFQRGQAAEDRADAQTRISDQNKAICSELALLGVYLENHYLPNRTSGESVSLLSAVFGAEDTFYSLVSASEMREQYPEEWLTQMKLLVLTSRRRIIALKGQLTYALRGGMHEDGGIAPAGVSTDVLEGNPHGPPPISRPEFKDMVGRKKFEEPTPAVPGAVQQQAPELMGRVRSLKTERRIF